MTMPRNLVLVRHGESEGNAAKSHSEKGDHSLYTKDFTRRHSSEWHLTDEGIRQAKVTGMWIMENIDPIFDRYYTSECLRAIETAAYLGLPHARWFTEVYLNERNWGFLDSMSQEERSQLYQKDIERRSRDGIYWAPPGWGSETMVDLALRAYEDLVETLHRECGSGSAIIVCHGEVMWAWRLRLERMPLSRYQELDASKVKRDRIANCQVLHYTRVNPATGDVTPHLNWMRSVCPWDMTRSRDWEKIERVSYSNTDLLTRAAKIPRMIDRKSM